MLSPKKIQTLMNEYESPVYASMGTSEENDEFHRRKRARKACLSCRKRKTRCDFDGDKAPCRRCREEDLICEIPDIDKRGGYGNVLAGKEKREREAADRLRLAEGTAPQSRPMSPITESTVLKNEMYTPNDAIEILHQASSERKRGIPSKTIATGFDYRQVEPRSKKRAISIENSNNTLLSTQRIPVHDSAIVADGILSTEEVCRLVGFFFAEIAPFYASYIPSEYQELARIAAEPALLSVVCTVGARCLDVNDNRNLQEKLWKYCQRTVSELMWECPQCNVRSLIFGVLTLCEWFPGTLLENNSSPGEALRRHTRICWPLMGQAVRIARYTGLLKNDIQTTIALHFSDHLLACRLGQQPMLDQLHGAEEEFPESAIRQCSLSDRARLDIVKLLHLANRSLYRSRTETQRLVSSGHHITILTLVHELVKKWESDYSDIVEGTAWSDRTTMFEFRHFQLYVFSVVLMSWQEKSVDKLLHFEESREFLNMAIKAAVFIIQHESADDIPVDLRFSPIQWITRLLHASVFLAKTLLTKGVYANRQKQQDIVSILYKASQTMAQLPPEDQHIYSKPLELICQRFMKRDRRKSNMHPESPHLEKWPQNPHVMAGHTYSSPVTLANVQPSQRAPDPFGLFDPPDMNNGDSIWNFLLHENILANWDDATPPTQATALDQDFGI